MTPECFPADIRGTALSMCSGSTRLGTIIGPLLSGIILDTYSGVFVAMVLYGWCCLFGSACTVFLKETKDKNADKGLIVHS